MNSKFAKVVLPAVLAFGSLGLATLATVPAGASTKAPHAVKAAATLTGKVSRVNVAKGMFWFKVGAKTYRANFTAATKFSKGTSASLIKGATVTVSGTYVGKSSVIAATSISA